MKLEPYEKTLWNPPKSTFKKPYNDKSIRITRRDKVTKNPNNISPDITPNAKKTMRIEENARSKDNLEIIPNNDKDRIRK